MRFKQFNEIWDYLYDPSVMPAVLGVAGVFLGKTGQWAKNKMLAPSKEANEIKMAFQELSQIADQYGKSSSQVRRQIDWIKHKWPGLESLASKQIGF